MKPPEDKRPPMVVASQVLNEATSAAISMALFPLGGYWLDSRWGTTPWLSLTGAIIGFSVGLKLLVNLGRPRKRTVQRVTKGKESASNDKSNRGNERSREK